MRNMTFLVAVVALIVSRVVFSAQQENVDDRFTRLGKVAEKDYKEALKALKDGLEKEKPLDRQGAVRSFGSVEDYRIIEELKKLFSHREADVRIAAAESMGTLKDARAAQTLTRSMARFKNSRPDSKTLVTIITALGRMNYWEASTKISDLLDSTDPAVKEAAVTALGDLLPAQYVGDIITAYENDKKSVKEAEERKDERAKRDLTKVVDAEFRVLRKITGESFSEPSDFKKWWKMNRALFKPYGGIRDDVTPKPIKKQEAP